MPETIIETERLMLREMNYGDVDGLLELFSDPEAMQYTSGVKTRDDVVGWVDWNRRSYSERGYGLWLLDLKDTGEPVGDCGLIYQQGIGDSDEVELSYHVIPRFWNRGYATEAAIAVRDYGLTTLGFKRLVSFIDPGNVASVRVAEKSGMTQERALRPDENRWRKAVAVFSIEV